MTDTTLLFALLRSEIGGESLRDDEKALYSPEILPQLAQLAKKHDVLHLVAHSLKKNGISCGEEPDRKLERSILTAVYRRETQEYERERICATLEAAHIPFIPLKGAVVRRYYPEPWMRTSCDIDILVPAEQVETAAERICAELEYDRQDVKNYHDISLMSPGGVHLELHFSICENEPSLDRVLSRCWDYAVADGGYRHRFTPEFFMLHHMAHLSYHFLYGGCGLRPVMDLWLLRRKLSFDETKYRQLLDECGIGRFADCLGQLSEVWFDGAEHTELTRQMEAYILHGGVYGTQQNRVAVQQVKEGGRLRYALARIFLPYESLRTLYPVLDEHRWLMPLMQVRRWFRVIFRGRLRHSVRELRMNGSISADERAETTAFLEKIGL